MCGKGIISTWISQEILASITLEMLKEHHSKYFAQIGAIGGRVRQEKYGNPGTTEGRIKGGRRAIETHRKRPDTNFFVAKKIAPIRKSTTLAEFLGILFGDGHVGKYQTTITLDSETDAEYAEYVAAVIQKNFQIIPHVRKRKHARAVEICISSVEFSEKMIRFGMVSGKKINGDLKIPEWIFRSNAYLAAFIRGLFDTDGSVYSEEKVIRNKTYHYVGMTITSASPKLRVDLMHAFRQLGYAPTCTDRQTSVFLRKKKDIMRYFDQISSHNPKHGVRYALFKRRCG